MRRSLNRAAREIPPMGVTTILPLVLVVLAAVTTGASTARAQVDPAAAPTVWIRDPVLVERALGSTLNFPPGADIAIQIFRNGHTLVPLTETFPAPLKTQDIQRVNAAVARWKASGHGHVYGALDVLRWAEEGVDYRQGVLGKHEDWIAKDPYGRFGDADCDGICASPYSPEVRAALVELARRTGRLLPSLDGIVLRATLAGHEQYLALTEDARVAYIREHQMDPIDGIGSGDRLVYQRESVTRLVLEMARAYRQEQPQGWVVGLGWAAYYAVDESWRGLFAGDWVAWAKAGAVNEMWLYPDNPKCLHEPAPASQVADAVGQARREGIRYVRVVEAGSAAGPGERGPGEGELGPVLAIDQAEQLPR